MSRILLLCVVAFVAGCKNLPHGIAIVPVTTVDEQTVLDGQALVLTNLNAGQTAKADDDEKTPAKCLCGGTGRSGDGLGPCACSPDCACKKVRAEVEQVPLFDEPTAGVTDEEPSVDSKPELEITDPFLEVQDDLEETVERVSNVTQKLSENQVEITNRLMDHESRLKALEEPKEKPVQSTGFTVEDATKTEVKRVAVKAVVVSRDNCPPCDRMAAIFPSLESSGWKIGDGPDCQIQRVNVKDLVSTNEAADAIGRTNGTPNTCFYKDGVFVRSVSGEMTSRQLANILNEIATGKVANAQPQVFQQTTILRSRKRLPVVRTQWGTIDLESYHRNCNCPMCQGIRALQAEYRQTAFVETENVAGAIQAAQQPTPSPVVDRIMETLNLSESDVFADIGCGDGRLLIDAVTMYGCTAVGIEIDPAKAKEAREKVAAAGLSDRITVLTGDANKFDPKAYGVTAAVAYLYPELLGQLKPMLETVPVLITPFHQVPGLVMESRGDLWVRDARNQPPLLR